MDGHPVMGIIIFCCVIINVSIGASTVILSLFKFLLQHFQCMMNIYDLNFQPIIALLRPADDHECRPCVNWIHWAFGTVAWCLASK